MLRLKHMLFSTNTQMTLTELRHETMFFGFTKIMWLNTLVWHVWGLRGLSHQHLWLRSPVGQGLSHSVLLCPLLWLLTEFSHVSIPQQQDSASFYSELFPTCLLTVSFQPCSWQMGSLTLKCLPSAVFTCKPHKVTSLSHYSWKSHSFLSILLVEPFPGRAKCHPKVFLVISIFWKVSEGPPKHGCLASTVGNMQNSYENAKKCKPQRV